MLTVNSGQPKQSQKRRASTTRKLRKQAPKFGESCRVVSKLMYAKVLGVVSKCAALNSSRVHRVWVVSKLMYAKVFGTALGWFQSFAALKSSRA